MKITFIRPAMMGERSSDAMEPLVFALLKALTPSDIELELCDERIGDSPDHITCDLAALSVETSSAMRAYQISDHLRSKGIKVIMGGVHPTVMPDEALEYADSVVIGDAEDNWSKVLEDFARGNLQKIYRNESPPSIENIYFDRSIFEGRNYGPIRLIQFGRGCKFSCDFCSIHAYYGKSIRHRSIKEVVEEIKSIKDKYFFFVDDNIFSYREKAKELFYALIPLKIKWVCQISMDVARDKELLELMKRSGCICVLIGFESLEVENLKQMKKAVNISSGDYRNIIKIVNSYHMMIYGTFVIGYDHDTIDSFLQVKKFATQNKFAIANINALMPMPGTALYKRLAEEGRLIFTKWWLNTSFRYGGAMYKLKGMTEEEFYEGCAKARFSFYSLTSIFFRVFNPCNFRNWFIYFIVNFVSRKEVRHKQNKALSKKV